MYLFGWWMVGVGVGEYHKACPPQDQRPGLGAGEKKADRVNFEKRPNSPKYINFDCAVKCLWVLYWVNVLCTCYHSYPSPYVRCHITVNKMC